VIDFQHEAARCRPKIVTNVWTGSAWLESIAHDGAVRYRQNCPFERLGLALIAAMVIVTGVGGGLAASTVNAVRRRRLLERFGEVDRRRPPLKGDASQGQHELTGRGRGEGVEVFGRSIHVHAARRVCT